MTRKTKYNENMKKYLFHLPEDIVIFLRRLADRQGITQAEFVRRALAEKIGRDMLAEPEKEGNDG